MENDQSIELQNKGQLSDLSPKPKKKIFSLKFILIAVFLIILLIVVGYIINAQTIKSAREYQQQSIVSPTVTQEVQADYSDFFRFSLPKPIENLTIWDLPNSRTISDTVLINDHLWYTGDGSVLEYDPKNEKLVSYSDQQKANCDEMIYISGYLYAACHTTNVDDAFGHETKNNTKLYSGNYSILKINPSTHKVERIFSRKDGLLSGSDYHLVADGDTVWVQTFNGLGKIDIKTNKVEFFQKELGYDGDHVNISNLLVDKDYVWAYMSWGNYIVGSIALYNKKTKTWKTFEPSDLKGINLNKFYVALLGDAMKLIPGGIQIFFEDDGYMEEHFSYETQTWTRVLNEQLAAIDSYEQFGKYYDSVYSSPLDSNYKNIDQLGFTQLQQIDSDKLYDVNGRFNYALSPVIDKKRYVLTSSSIDVIDENSSFSRILISLGESLPSDGVGYADIEVQQGLVRFVIDKDSLLAFVLDPDCGGVGCHNDQKAWLIDLAKAKIIKTYTNFELASSGAVADMRKEDNSLIISDKDNNSVYEINLADYSLASVAKDKSLKN